MAEEEGEPGSQIQPLNKKSYLKGTHWDGIKEE